MKLKEVEILDFKSIIREKFVITSNQLCLVGKNESGKSSIIQAISYLNILGEDLSKNLLNKSSEKYPDGMPIIVGLFELSKQDYLSLYDSLQSFTPNQLLSILPKYSNTSLLQVKRWGNGISNISIDLTDKKS